MKLTPINININDYPDELHQFLHGAKLYDSSCSPQASVIFIDKEDGYFLKSAPKNSLSREAALTKYFHGKGLSAEVLVYRTTDENDWLLTSKIHGDDCIAAKYLEQPERLCDTLAERLALLHSLDFSDCPVQNHLSLFLDSAKRNKDCRMFDKDIAVRFGYANAEEAWSVLEKNAHLFKPDMLLHGDYCLPNIILNDWKFSGFIDLDSGGVGDRHIDLFWAMWSLGFNLKTDKYRKRFTDAYGRDKIDEEMLKIVAAAEVFG